nr:phospho-N-acetylmuramoyl-pentapeptide-transferase homolog isoform X2 [Ipomoea batatas]
MTFASLTDDLPQSSTIPRVNSQHCGLCCRSRILPVRLMGEKGYKGVPSVFEIKNLKKGAR